MDKNKFSKKQIQKANENMHYIKEKIIMKNDVGNYEIDDKELSNSSFSNEEKRAIVNFTNFMNKNQGIQSRSNQFTRCLQDALDLGKALANELAREIEKGNYLAAAAKLVAAGLFATPAAAFTFILLCGPTPVE